MSAFPVAISCNPRHKEHAISGNPERPERVEAVENYLRDTGMLQELLVLPPREATDSELQLVHPAAHVERIRRLDATGGGAIDPDTSVVPGSFGAASGATGGVLSGVDVVVRREAAASFCLTRPPGHHATADRAMGFCLFNSVAVAAAYARSTHQMERVAIVDYDVHHGNGTQDIFWEDPNVLYLSTHQYPFYPGSGHWSQIGGQGAEGSTVNVPLPSGCGDEEYLRTFDRLLLPVIDRFRPDLLLVSAGYDAHEGDPLAGMQLTTQAYGAIMRRLRGVADLVCGGRIVAVLEGGYDVDDLAESVGISIEALREPEPAYAQSMPAVKAFEQYLENLRKLHGLDS
jgi:acetoin utilization deacetylase AcuC-like enzyme